MKYIVDVIADVTAKPMNEAPLSRDAPPPVEGWSYEPGFSLLDDDLTFRFEREMRVEAESREAAGRIAVETPFPEVPGWNVVSVDRRADMVIPVSSDSPVGGKVVITHPEYGVYVGHALGFGFWTLMDPVGQDKVTTFKDEDDARDHIKGWDSKNDPEAYGYVAITCDGDYATIPDLIAAGLEDQLGDMAAEHLKYATPAGMG